MVCVCVYKTIITTRIINIIIYTEEIILILNDSTYSSDKMSVSIFYTLIQLINFFLWVELI